MNKKVYIRGYKSAKKVCIDAKKVCIDAKKVYIIAEKVYIDTKKGLHFCTIGLQHLSKNDKKVYQMQTSVNQCKPFQRFTSICPPMFFKLEGTEENQGVNNVIRASMALFVFRQSPILWTHNTCEEELGTGIPTVLQGNIVAILLNAVRKWRDHNNGILHTAMQ